MKTLIEKYIKKHNLSNSQLAQAIGGVSRVTIDNIIKGVNTPNFILGYKLVKFLRIPDSEISKYLKIPQQLEVIENEIEFYDQDDREYLRFDNFDEAVENIIDEYNLDDIIPETIELWSWRRATIKEDRSKLAEIVAERFHEYLEEKYGYEDPLTDISEFEPFALEFVNKSIEVYNPWQCEKVEKFTVNTQEWVTKNAPEWIDEGIKFSKETHHSKIKAPW